MQVRRVPQAAAKHILLTAAAREKKKRANMTDPKITTREREMHRRAADNARLMHSEITPKESKRAGEWERHQVEAAEAEAKRRREARQCPK